VSTPLRDRLRELEAEARQVTVLPAAAVRARGRRRAWRQRMSVAAAVAVVAAGGVGFAATHTGKHQRVAAPMDKGLSCTISLPDDPAEVRVRVIDGGAAAGMTDKALTGLRNRRFTVASGPSREADDPNGGVVLRYGPAAIGNATLLRAYFPGSAAMIFDPSRQDDVIDLTVGPGFASFHTTTEVIQVLVQEGEPTAPPQCTSFKQR
jgi:LytR cell envelope-related transcriptional attenuator